MKSLKNSIFVIGIGLLLSSCDTRTLYVLSDGVGIIVTILAIIFAGLCLYGMIVSGNNEDPDRSDKSSFGCMCVLLVVLGILSLFIKCS